MRKALIILVAVVLAVGFSSGGIVRGQIPERPQYSCCCDQQSVPEIPPCMTYTVDFNVDCAKWACSGAGYGRGSEMNINSYCIEDKCVTCTGSCSGITKKYILRLDKFIGSYVTAEQMYDNFKNYLLSHDVYDEAVAECFNRMTKCPRDACTLVGQKVKSYGVEWDWLSNLFFTVTFQIENFEAQCALGAWVPTAPAYGLPSQIGQFYNRVVVEKIDNELPIGGQEYRSQSGGRKQSIYIDRQTDCYNLNGTAYQFIPSMTFNVPVTRTLLFEKQCNVTVNDTNTILLRFEDSELLGGEFANCTYETLGSQEIAITSAGGIFNIGDYHANAGTFDAVYNIPAGAVDSETAVTIKKLRLNCGAAVTPPPQPPPTTGLAAIFSAIRSWVLGLAGLFG